MAERNRTSDQLVSVVMPAYRMGAFIGEALASVGAQSYANWEVIVVDDHGPEDGTAAIVDAFAKAWPGKRVEFIRHPENRGVSAARNTAIAAAKGALVAFLDPDDIWLSTHLEHATRLIVDVPGADVACCPMQSFQHGAYNGWKHDMLFEGWQKEHFPMSIAAYNFIQPSGVVLWREKVLEVEGFSEDHCLQHIEDYDLWIRLAMKGCGFVFGEVITSRYRKHPGAATRNSQRMRALQRALETRHEDFFRQSQRHLIRHLFQAAYPGRPGMRFSVRRGVRQVYVLLRSLMKGAGRTKTRPLPVNRW